MRFCMLTTYYPPYHFGGDAIFVQALARALAAEGHLVEVVHCEDAYHLRGRKQAAVEAEEDGVVVHRLRNPFGMLSPLITQQIGIPGVKAAQLRILLKREFDVVNFHNISLIGGPGVLKMSRAPVTLYTLHWFFRPQNMASLLSQGEIPDSYRYIQQFKETADRHGLLYVIVLLPQMKGNAWGPLPVQLTIDGIMHLDLSALSKEFTREQYMASRFDPHASPAVHRRIGELLTDYVQHQVGYLP